MPTDRIVIAGAGMVGASIAYHLAKRGAAVTLLEAIHPGAGATGKSLGWINATFSKRPRAYFDLNVAGIAAWRRLESELPSVHVQWGGSVAWFPAGPEAEELRDNVRNHREWDYPVHILDPGEIAQLLPAVEPGEAAVACHSEAEGAVDPMEALTALLAKAQEFGVEVRFPHEAQEIDARIFVLAGGVGSPRLARLAGINVPLKDSPGVLLHLAPAPRLIDRVVLAPGTHFKQSHDGRIVAGGPIVAGAGTAITEASVEQGVEIRALVERYLPQLKSVPVERVMLGHRVMPVDEYPIVGFATPTLYVAVTHSGVTLAPLIGELAAQEILDGICAKMLEPYRPSRFA